MNVLPKICGIETEYGILARGLDVTAMMASSLLVNAYTDQGLALRAWDFADESPDIDARDGWRPEADYPEVEVLMANSVLTNGARYYVDHAHPEVSTPECVRPSEVVLYDRAAEEIVRVSLARANARLGAGAELLAYKNNSDGKGNSYGCHENYLLSRQVPFGLLARCVATHFVSRQVFCGAGKVGVEMAREGEVRPAFQISQRADFFEEEIGLETTIRRPIVNTRDEPHADPERYRRLHVIAGDANMSEVATFLKVGTTALLLAVIEAAHERPDFESTWPQILDPVASIRAVSHDPALKTLVALTSGESLRALDIQWKLLELCQRWWESAPSDPLGGETSLVLERWKQVLTYLEDQDARAARWVDWMAKKRVCEATIARQDLNWDHPKIRAIDLQYHDMRTDRCVAAKVGLETVVRHDEVLRAMDVAPESTRAYFRGECIRRWPDSVVSANWDSLVFDIGEVSLQRVPMMDPLTGTKSHVGALLDSVGSPSQLLDALGESAVEEVALDPGW